MSDTRKEQPDLLDHRAESFARPMMDDLRNRERKAHGRVPPAVREALAPRYDIEGEIGSGGMAVVYKAFDNVLKRNVAVKVLRPELADGLTTDRFELEISIAAPLDHPHIVPLHDRGGAGGVLYYVMRLVAGESLRDRLERHRQLEIPEAIGIARHVAEALDYAHGQRVVHRDIKPENILLDAHGAYVTDFGIARIQDAVGVERLTRTGIAIGTAPYMSPEQIDTPRTLDGRSDVYALTCVLFEMLAGEPPYTGRNARDVLAKHLAAAIPDLGVVRSTVTPRMQQVIVTGLQKAAVDRFPSARQLVDSFERAFKSSSEPAVPVAPRPRTLAVLPFTNMSADRSSDYLGDGIADDLIGALIRAGSLRVVARTSSFHFKGQQLDIREIGVALGATHLLEGSVRVAGGRLRATAQLVDAVTGHPLWSERFDRDLEDVFAVQDEITNAISKRLRRELEAPAQEEDGVVEGGDLVFSAEFDEPSAPAGAPVKPVPADTIRELLVEATRGDYEIDTEIGHGGMCVVYRARDVALGRPVAIKALRAGLTPVGSHRERMKREAGIALRLDHAHILPVYSVRDRPEILLFVMRLVSGPSLRKVLNRTGELPISAALLVLHQVGSALAYAHSRSVMHHDLRPENIMIDEAGSALVTDFGIAMAWESEDRDEGIVIGTPTYMSPERMQGTTVTQASDQYALGVIAYEMLTGAPPFPGGTFSEIITSHLFQPPADLRQARPSIPPQVAETIRRMLAKDPADRFPDCNAAIEALGAFDAQTAREDLRMVASSPLALAASRWGASRKSRTGPEVLELESRARPLALDRFLGWLASLFRRPTPRTEPHPPFDETTSEWRSVRLEREEPQEMATSALTPTPYRAAGQRMLRKRFPAYDEYLRGRFLLNFESRPDSIAQAIHHFDVAIAGNDAFAPAYAARAVARTMLARAGVMPSSPHRIAGEDDVARALSIDPNLAEAHVAKALVAMFFHWDRETALDALDLAIATSPAYAEPYLWRGFALNWLEGTSEPAIDSLNRALDLDPLSLVTRVELAFAYLLKGDLDQALRDADEAVASGLMFGTKPRGEDRDKKPESEGFASAHYARAFVLTQLGRYDEALVEGREALRVGGRQPLHMALVGMAHALRGDVESAQGMIAKIESYGADGGIRVATAVATVYAGLRDNENTLTQLRKALKWREVNLVLARFSPHFAHLRSEPRFSVILERMR